MKSKVKVTHSKWWQRFRVFKNRAAREEEILIDFDRQVKNIVETKAPGLLVRYEPKKASNVLNNKKTIDIEAEVFMEYEKRHKPKVFKILLFFILFILIILVVLIIILKWN